MSAPAEVLAYIQTLAWPSVAMTGFLLFRQQIKDVISRISEISIAGASVKTRDEQQAAKLADESSFLAESVVEDSKDSSLPSPPPPRSTRQRTSWRNTENWKLPLKTPVQR